MGQNYSSPNDIEDSATINLKRRKRVKDNKNAFKPPTVYAHCKCKLKLLKLAKQLDFLNLENDLLSLAEGDKQGENNPYKQVMDQLRGNPVFVGTLEEFVDDNHAIVSTGLGPEYYVSIMSFVDKDMLEPGYSALIRPGRIDRKIEFGLPDAATKKKIFQIHTSKMTLEKNVDIDQLVTSKEDLNGADIKAICTEAGMIALRERRRYVGMDDFVKAREKVFYNKQNTLPAGLYS
ncbi:26S protease regulatory subunit 4, partial [Nosema bombycis CQ1]